MEEWGFISVSRPPRSPTGGLSPGVVPDAHAEKRAPSCKLAHVGHIYAMPAPPPPSPAVEATVVVSDSGHIRMQGCVFPLPHCRECGAALTVVHRDAKGRVWSQCPEWLVPSGVNALLGPQIEPEVVPTPRPPTSGLTTL